MQRANDDAERLLGAAYFALAWVPECNTGGTNAEAFDQAYCTSIVTFSKSPVKLAGSM